MRILTAQLLSILLLAAGCGRLGPWTQPTIKGSGSIVTEERVVADFDRVSLSGAGHLTIVQGDEESLAITTDDNLLEHLASEVSGGRLKIGPRQVSLRPTKDIQYVLRLKKLHQLDLSGSLSAKADSLETDSIALRISGSGNIQIATLQTSQCETHISGSGKVQLAGRTVNQELRVSGSGDYRASDLQSNQADIRISGSGDATVWVVEQLNILVSGSGSVSYYGSPKTRQSVSGSGKVRGLGPRS